MPEEKDVKNGCCSCVYKTLMPSKEPCKSCVRWSNWLDKDLAPRLSSAAK